MTKLGPKKTRKGGLGKKQNKKIKKKKRNLSKKKNKKNKNKSE